MKFAKLVTATTLTTIILSGGVSALADEVRSVTTEGNIEFIPNTDEPIIVVPPETDPEVEIDPIVPGSTGPLTIANAVPMNFGIQAISSEDKTVNMIAEMHQKKGTTGDNNKVPYVSFAQVIDTRGSNAGWDLTLSLSEFESNTQNSTLKGAMIILKNPEIVYSGNNQELSPSFSQDRVELSADNGPVSIMTAEQGKGAGRSSIQWGDQETLNRQFEADGFDPEKDIVENDSIQLVVPGETAKDQAVYKATLTWNLTTTPGPDAGTEDGGTTPETEVDSE